MDNVQTMDLNETGASMMVPLTSSDSHVQQQQQHQPPAASQPEKNLQYNSNPPPPLQQQQQQQTMDSTPIADIMSMNEVQPAAAAVAQAPHPPPLGGEDPRAAVAMMQQQQPVFSPAMAQQQQQHQAMMPASKYPMNLTDEQVEALFVGLVAVVAFSKPLQEKLATMVPKFVNESGSRSMTGLATTGVVAAGLFYFGRRMVFKN